MQNMLIIKRVGKQPAHLIVVLVVVIAVSDPATSSFPRQNDQNGENVFLRGSSSRN